MKTVKMYIVYHMQLAVDVYCYWQSSGVSDELHVWDGS